MPEIPYDKVQALRYQILDGTLTQTYGRTELEPNGHTGADIVIANTEQYYSVPADNSHSVRAPISGRVQVKRNSSGYGNHVVIFSPTNYAMLIGHLQDFITENTRNGTPLPQGRVLQNGDIVQAGDIIGHQGNTGWSTGPHVHYSILNPLGQYVDPLLGLPATSNPSVNQQNQGKRNLWYVIAHDLGFGGGDRPGQLPTPPPSGTGPAHDPVVFPFRGSDGSTEIPPDVEDRPPIPIPDPDVIIENSGGLTNLLFGVGVFTLGSIVFIFGMLMMIKEKPVQTVIQPVVDTGKTAAKVAAIVAK